MPRSVGRTRRATRKVTTPIGRLMKKIQCQLRASVRTPPSTCPMDAPAAPVNENTAMALARSRGSLKRVTRMPRPTAEAIALPTPWRKRAPMSIAGAVAAPASRDATVKTTVPARNMRVRPIRSPSRPESRSRLPKAIR